MIRWKLLMILLASVTPGVVIVLGVVLQKGLLAGVGVVAYLLLILTAALVKVSGNPSLGYGFHVQFRQGHQSDIDHVLGGEKPEHRPLAPP
jgi:hypothetical protein